MIASARRVRMGRLGILVCGLLVAAGPIAAAAPAPASAPDDGYFDRSVAPAPAPPPPPPVKAPRTAAGPLVRLDAPADQGVAGYASVFFVRPQREGADVAGQGRETADAFCRDQGLGAALSYDSNGRSLRDVLCRRK